MEETIGKAVKITALELERLGSDSMSPACLSAEVLDLDCMLESPRELSNCTPRLHPRASGYTVVAGSGAQMWVFFESIPLTQGTDSHIGNYWSGETMEKLTSSVAMLPHL